MSQQEIRVIIFKDSNGIWHGQCLEYDIAAQADNFEGLRSRLELTLNAEALASEELFGEVFAGMGPAPDVFHEMWSDRNEEFNYAPIHVEKNGFQAQLGLAA